MRQSVAAAMEAPDPTLLELLALLAAGAKETRDDRSARKKAAWARGDRRQWGGDLRKRDARRGWRNFAHD
jgi:hypothetical protein